MLFVFGIAWFLALLIFSTTNEDYKTKLYLCFIMTQKLFYIILSLFSFRLSAQIPQGIWVSDVYTYVVDVVVHRKIVYTISNKLLQLQINTRQQNKDQSFEDNAPPPLSYSFVIEKITGTPKTGHIIVKIPKNIHKKAFAPYGVLLFSKQAPDGLRIHFALNNTYSSVDEAQKQTKKSALPPGILLTSQAQYKVQQQLPAIPAITSASFAQLQKAVQKQLHKSVYRRRIKKNKQDPYLKDEVLKRVFLKKGYNPYLSMRAMLVYQQKRMEANTRLLLTRQLAKHKKLVAALSDNKPTYNTNKAKKKAALEASKLAIKLAEKKLAYLDLRQKLRQFNQQKVADFQKRTQFEAQLKQLKQQIEVLTQQQFKVPYAPVRFKPVRN